MLKLDSIIDKEVSAIEAWSLFSERLTTTNPWEKGVLTRIPLDFTEDIIKEDSGAIMNRRII